MQLLPPSEEDEYTLYSVSSKATKPLMVEVKLNGIDAAMEVDTSVSVSILSEESFKPLHESGMTLHRSSAKLFTYTGKLILVPGTTDVRVDHNGQIATLPLYVARDLLCWDDSLGEKISLFRVYWMLTVTCSLMDWGKLKVSLLPFIFARLRLHNPTSKTSSLHTQEQS